MAERIHPLAALAAASPRCDAVQLAVLPPVARLLLRGDASAVGWATPAVCRAVVADGNALLWLGPDEFLLLAAGESAPDLTVGEAACVVDVSHRQTGLVVTGARAAWAINAFCALDLHIAAFPVGMCTRTLMGKAEIVLWRTGADAFRIEVARSFAPYVWSCLEEARRECFI